MSRIWHRGAPAILAALLLGCGTSTRPTPPAFDPGRCRAGAAQMTLGHAIQGRLDVPAGDAGGCWQLEAPAGTLAVTVNLDQPKQIEQPVVRFTDAIGQTLARSPIGVLGSAQTVEYRVDAPTTIIVELRAAGGASSFGMQARHSPPEPTERPPEHHFEPSATETPAAPGPKPAPKPRPRSPVVADPPPPGPPPIRVSCTRIRPLHGAGPGVELTGNFSDTEAEQIDWSGPITVMDGPDTLATAVLETRGERHAVVKAPGLTRHRAKGCALRFARRAR